jgi:hypothetical protein
MFQPEEITAARSFAIATHFSTILNSNLLIPQILTFQALIFHGDSKLV